MASASRRATVQAQQKVLDLGIAAPQVVAHRLARMALAGPVPSARDQKEFAGMVLEKNGEIVVTGAGAATMASPVNAMVWLANTLGRLGSGLRDGERDAEEQNRHEAVEGADVRRHEDRRDDDHRDDDDHRAEHGGDDQAAPQGSTVGESHGRRRGSDPGIRGYDRSRCVLPRCDGVC